MNSTQKTTQKRTTTYRNIPQLFALGVSILWAGAAHAQVNYAPMEADGVVVTGIRSNSLTMDDVVITSSVASGGVVKAALYAGSLEAVPSAPLSSWNALTPNIEGESVTSSTFYGPNTPLFDPSIGVGNVRAVGSYKYSNSGHPDFNHGMIYQGPVSGCPGGSSSCWTQIDANSLVPPGETLKNTIAHSNMGHLVVGDWDTDLAVGRAFIYDITAATFTDLNPTGAKSVTAYGIWQNSDGSYTMTGGSSDINTGGLDEGWVADYDAVSKQLSHLKMYHFNNQPLDSLISHFDGITVTADGYNLTGDFVTTSGTEGGFFASVTRLPDGSFSEAEWTSINVAYAGASHVRLTSGNTVLDNHVLGIFSGAVTDPVTPAILATLSYVATVTPTTCNAKGNDSISRAGDAARRKAGPCGTY
jgi:hypothetical protein